MTNLTPELVSIYVQMRSSKCVRKSVFDLPKGFKMLTWKASLSEHYESMNADFVHYYEKFVDFESIFYMNRISPPLGYIVDEDLEDFGDLAEVQNPLAQLATFFVLIQDLSYRYNFRVNLVCSSQSKVSPSEKEQFRSRSNIVLQFLSVIATSVMAQLLSWFEHILRQPPYTADTLRNRREELMLNALEISHKALEESVIRKLSLDQIKEFARIDDFYARLDSYRESE